MKVLLVGSDKKYAIEHYYIRHLADQNIDIKLFPANRIYQDYYHSSFWNKIVCRLGLSQVLNRINRSLLHEVRLFKPDILWVFKGMELRPSILKIIKDQGIKLVNYNPDHPYIFTGRGSGNKNVSQSVDLYDLYFTYSSDIKKQIQSRYKVETKVLPFGFEVSESVIHLCKNQDEIVKLCFIGNPDPQRVAFLEKLAAEGVSMDLYGHGWKEHLKHPYIEVHEALYQEEFWKTIYRYRIQLNLMRIHNETSHNMRSFEVPGVGGLLLAPDTLDHRTFFESGKEIFLFKDLEECVQRIKYLLSMTKEESGRIRNAAYEKSRAAGYRYKDRAYFVKQCFEQLLS